MSSPAQLSANIANAQHSTGPRTGQGKAASSQNAVKSGLFSTRDFIRPGENPIYAELSESIRRELAPVGELESTLADEIRRAMWRLRRCAETEAAMLETCLAAATGPAGAGEPTSIVDAPISDPMQNEATAPIQRAVDRARSQCHRLLHKCTAELRKLQTERMFRLEELGPKADSSFMGLADLRAIRKSLDESTAGQLRKYKVTCIEADNAHTREVNRQMALPDDWLPGHSAKYPLQNKPSSRQHPLRPLPYPPRRPLQNKPTPTAIPPAPAAPASNTGTAVPSMRRRN